MTPTPKLLNNIYPQALDSHLHNEYVSGENLIERFSSANFHFDDENFEDLVSIIRFNSSGSMSFVDMKDIAVAMEQNSLFTIQRLSRASSVSDFCNLGENFSSFFGHAIVQSKILENLLTGSRDIKFEGGYPESMEDLIILESAVWNYAVGLCSFAIDNKSDSAFIAEKFNKIFLALKNIYHFKANRALVEEPFDSDSKNYYRVKSDEYKGLANEFQFYIESL